MSHHDCFPNLLLGFSLQLMNHPLSTSLTLFCLLNSSDTSNLPSHPPLPQKATSPPTHLPGFPAWRATAVCPGTACFSTPVYHSIPSPGAYNNLLPQQLPVDPPCQITFPFKFCGSFQMLCTPWMRQEGHQECLRHSLTGCAFQIRYQDLTLASGAQIWKAMVVPCSLRVGHAHHIENPRTPANKTFSLSIY